MEFRNKEIDKKQMAKSIFCISVGTAAGLLVYGIFLFFHIDIFGWNLGLIFAPLAAGYVETILADQIIGENIGAISAFILFIDTTFYSFILKNPTLGWNIITAGSIIVILQAAFPTLINYILLVVVGGILSNFFKTIKKYETNIKNRIQNQQFFRWETKDVEIETESLPVYDELESNQMINSAEFYFITSPSMKDKKYEIIQLFHSEVIVEKNKKIINAEPEKAEYLQLIRIKDGKDECLIKLLSKIKNAGGNGILDLSINYSLIGYSGESIQITAMGIGVLIDN
ncbi:MAG: hypothetical protein J6P09_09215 [Methanobrevibacter sp.]|nr:hypothetical protein [Methanobrevibacter sp.]